jgi:putative methylase
MEDLKSLSKYINHAINSGCMSKKELAIALSRLKLFERPSEKEEQYPTDSEVAADALWTANISGDIEGKTIADLGCGTGMLGIGALLLGAKRVYFVEKDQATLNIALENIRGLKGMFEGQAVACREDIAVFNDKVDVVVMNPPFGTREEHADTKFLDRAFILAPVVFSFHKASTKEYIGKYAEKNGFRIAFYKEYDFPLKQTMKHHKSRIRRISVGLWRFCKA